MIYTLWYTWYRVTGYTTQVLPLDIQIARQFTRLLVMRFARLTLIGSF